MKSGTDDIHKLTEAVYKNLVDNFNSGVRQILLTGKAYYKSLQAVSSTAVAYNDALSRVGSMAKICRGGTEDIGEAILQIAEAQREIQARLEDSTKALLTELILPLEQKLDKDFKKAQSDARKYAQGHKVVLSPYNKACEALKKFRKKTKNKFVYDNEKEAQHMRSLGKCQEKLDQYRIQGLKASLLEERRCHCFVLQRLCSISHLSSLGHRHGYDMYQALPEWQDMCTNPHVLPPQAQLLIADFVDEHYEPMNGGPGYHSNGFLHRDRDTQSLGNEVRRSRSSQDLYRQSNHFDGTRTLPPRTAPPPPPGQVVEAIYSFNAEVDSQLSFTQGDIVHLMGEKSDGWQYGQNMSTQRLGWFPLSFTKDVVTQGRDSPDFNQFAPVQRTKSVGDMLDSRSLSEYTHHYEHDIPGNVRRPKSLYDGPPASPHAVGQVGGPLVPFSSIYSPPPPISHYPTHSAVMQTDCAPIYQHIPTFTDSTQQLPGVQYSRWQATPHQASTIYSSHGRPQPEATQGAATFYGEHQGSVPPPPSFIPPVPGTTTLGLHRGAQSLQQRSHTLPAGGPPSVPRVSNMAMTPRPPQTSAPLPPPINPPPQPPPPPPLPPTTGPSKPTTPSFKPLPPPASNKPTSAPPLPPSPASSMAQTKPMTPVSGKPPQSTPVTSSLSALISQQQQQHSPQRNSRLSGSSSQGFGSPARQQPSQAPPPPPLRDSDSTNTIEENVDYRNNPMFASVSLRQTKTNDRSAPKL